MADAAASVRPDDLDLYFEPIDDEPDLYFEPIGEDAAPVLPNETEPVARQSAPEAPQKPIRGLGYGLPPEEHVATPAPAERAPVGASVRGASRARRAAEREQLEPMPQETQRAAVDMAGIADDPESTAAWRAVKRGGLRTASSVPTIKANVAAQALRDMQNGDEWIIRDTFLEVTGLDNVPDGADLSSVRSAIASLPAEDNPTVDTARLLRDRVEDRKARAAAAAADPDGYRTRAEESITAAKSLMDRANALPMSPAAERMKRRLAADESFVGTLATLFEHPAEAAMFLSETGIESTPQIAGAAASAAITRSPALSAAALGAGTMTQEYGASVFEFLAEHNVPLDTPDDAIAILNRPGLLKEASKRGLTRGVVIAAFETLGQGIAAKELLRSKVGDALVQTVVQMATGGGGEASAMLAAGQEFSPQEVLIEALAEITQTPAEVSTAAYAARKAAQRERLLTSGDRASPLPDDVIARGKAKLAEIEARKNGAVPEGAVPMSTLYGADPAPEIRGLGTTIGGEFTPEVRPSSIGLAPEAQDRRPTPPNLGVEPITERRDYAVTPQQTETPAPNGPTPAPAETSPQDAVPPQGIEQPAGTDAAVSPPPQRPKARPTLKRRPFTDAVKTIGIHPDGPLAAELRAQDITPQTVPGLFRRTGAMDMDNLPADEWRDYAPVIGEDGQGYLDRQGIIDAIVDENAGRPVQVGEQADLQAERDAADEIERLRASGDLDANAAPEPEGDIVVATIKAPADDIAIGEERRGDIESVVRGAIGPVGLDGVLTDAEIGNVVDRLDANGGNVEDALWWAAERELEDAGRERTGDGLEDLPFGDDAGPVAPRAGDADQEGSRRDPVRPAGIGTREAEGAQGGEDRQRAPEGQPAEGERGQVGDYDAERTEAGFYPRFQTPNGQKTDRTKPYKTRQEATARAKTLLREDQQRRGAQPSVIDRGPADPRFGLPEGARIFEGNRPMTKGRFRVGDANGERLSQFTNWEATPEDAARNVAQAIRNDEIRGEEKARQERAESDIKARLMAGEQPTDADLKTLDLKERAQWAYISPVVQRLFGISNRKVREAMGDALYKVTSDSGAEYWNARSKQALRNAAIYAGAVDVAKPTPAPIAPATDAVAAFGAKWDRMTEEQRGVYARAAGWTIQDGSRLNPTGRGIVKRSWADQAEMTRETLTRFATETVTPAEDTRLGKNMAGEDIYEREDGSRYRMRNDRPDFGGDLAVRDDIGFETETTPEGEQAVIPGSREDQGRDRLKDKAEVDARSQQSKMRRGGQERVEDDTGGLFGAPETDLFDAPPAMRRNADYDALSDVEKMAARKDEFAEDLATEFGRYERLKWKAYDKTGRRSNSKAKMNLEKIAEKYGLSAKGYSDLDILSGMLSLGSLSRRSNYGPYVLETVDTFIASRTNTQADAATEPTTPATAETSATEPTTLEDYADTSKGRVHVYAEFRGARYYTGTYANYQEAEAAATAKGRRYPGASVFTHDRADSTRINGTEDDLQAAITAQAAPVAEQPTTRTKDDKIEDFGEVLEGAAKHRAAEWAKRIGDVPDMDVVNQPLSKSWPEPNYQQMLDDGVDPAAVAFIRAARDEIPAKPRGWRAKRWAQQVAILRDFARKLADGTHTMTEVLDKAKGVGALEGVMGRTELYQRFGHDKSLKGIDLKEHTYTIKDGKRYDPALRQWEVTQPRKATAWSNMPRTLSEGATREEAIEAFAPVYEALDAGKKTAARKAKNPFSIWRDRTDNKVHVGRKIGSDYTSLATFDDVAEARKYRDENQEALAEKFEQWKAIPFERNQENRDRIGKDRRDGRDVAPETFQEAFGFRGVQFGNYVEGPRRQADLNQAYDALSDLSIAIDVPTEALSLHGSLGLAFGARGKGGKRAAAAHFEPDSIVINLTKRSGAGSLAHEWWHGLDNYFSRMKGLNLEYMSERTRGASDGVRPEVIAAFKGVTEAVKATGIPARAAELDKRRSAPYWSTMREMTARVFEQYIIDKVESEGGSNDFLANIVSEDTWGRLDAFEGRELPSYPYLKESEKEAVFSAFDALFEALETERTETGVRLYQQQDAGAFAANVLTDLAAADDLFLYPTKTGTDLAAIVAETSPDLTYEGEMAPADITADAPDVERHLFRSTAGRRVVVYRTDDEVWLNVEDVKEGEGGSEIYASVADYAYNTGRRFIGDPDGLSDVALRRRTEAMLSSAIKHGTTDHLAPHERQITGDENLGVPPLEWKDGDTVGNVASMIRASVANLAHSVPEFQRARYDFQQRAFVDSQGQRLSDEVLDGWASRSGRVRAARAGSRTLKRGILLNSLLRTESGQRPGLLEQVLQQSRQLVEQGGLAGIFYRRTSAVDTSRVTAAMADLRKSLDKIGLRNVQLAQDAGMAEQAAFERDQYGSMRIIIGAAANPEASLRHEVIHALKASGLFTKAEWAALEQRAKSLWMAQYDIAGRYGDLSEEAQIEEAIAEGFANWKPNTPASPIKNAFAKVKRFLRAVRDWMQGQGIRNADDLFGAIERGDVGARQRLRDLISEVGGFYRAAQVAGNGKGIRAYHGSPHDFDRFDMSKIGTGEGAQAYGHGLYFAEAEDVAKEYRSNLSGGRRMSAGVSFDGGDVFDAPDGARAMLTELDPILKKTGSVDAALKELDDRAANGRLTYTRIRSKDMADFLRKNRDRIDYTPPGHIYEVSINADPADFLDWDAPLSEQPQRVRDLTAHWTVEPDGYGMHHVKSGDNVLGYTGYAGRNKEDLAGHVLQHHLSADKGPDWAKNAGIPGIKYYDGMSRAGGEGTRNYVVFDDSIITIIRKEQRQAARNDEVSKEAGERVDFAVTPDATPQERQESFVRAAMTQPLDSAFKVLFMPFGGINAEGKWRWGVAAERRITDLVTKSEIPETSVLSFMNPAIKRARIGIMDRYGLPEEYIELERQRGIDQSRLMHEGLDFVKQMKSVEIGTSEAQVLQAILTGEAVDEKQFGALPAAIRASIDEMGQEAVRLGLISPESYERNLGTYLHRVYEGHETQTGPLGRMTGAMARGRRVKVAGDQFKGRGIFEEVAAGAIWKGNDEYLGARRGAPQKGDRIIILDKMSDANQGGLDGVQPGKPHRERRVYWPAETPIPARYASYENRGTFEVRGEPGKTITLWRDFTRDERTRMGEILDARYTVAKTYHMMAQDLATGRFFKALAENEDWVKTSPPEGAVVAGEDKKSRTDPDVEWIRVPGTKIGKSETLVYGALAGKYIRADIWRDMEELRRMQTPGWWRPVLTQWKLSKTARGPVVHMNNIMSNFMLMDMANVRLSDLAAAISEMRHGGEMYEEAKSHGAFGADMVAQEIRRDVLEPMLKEIRDEIRGGKGGLEAEAGRVGLAPLGMVADRVIRGLGAADRAMVSAYQMEDEVFRMATYLRRRKEGASAQEAAIEARDQFLNYDIRAPWVNAARNSVLPFISYTYRAIPRLFKTLAERPWKMAKYATVAHVLNNLGYLLAPSGDDEEEERGSLRNEEQGRTWLGTPRLIRMPWLAGEDPVFLDTRRWIPGGDIFETGQNEALPMVPNWLQVGGPIVLGAEIWLNRSAFTGEDIVNEVTDTPSEMLAKQSGHLYRSWMPSAPWVPGGWYWNKIGRALNDEARTYSGDPYRLPDALWSSVGVKLQPKDVDFGYQMHGFRFDEVEREVNMELRSVKRQRQRGLISAATYQDEIDRLSGKMALLNEKRRELQSMRH